MLGVCMGRPHRHLPSSPSSPPPLTPTWATQQCRRSVCVCGNAADMPASSSSVRTRPSRITSSVNKGRARRSGGGEGCPMAASGSCGGTEEDPEMCPWASSGGAGGSGEEKEGPDEGRPLLAVWGCTSQGIRGCRRARGYLLPLTTTPSDDSSTEAAVAVAAMVPASVPPPSAIACCSPSSPSLSLLSRATSCIRSTRDLVLQLHSDLGGGGGGGGRVRKVCQHHADLGEGEGGERRVYQIHEDLARW